MSRSKKAAIDQDNQDQLPPAPPAVVATQADDMVQATIQRRIDLGKKEREAKAQLPIPMPHYGELLEEYFFA